MSFAAIRSTAYSAIAASQVRTQIAANNIANADTEGYSTKSASQSAAVTGTLGGGVTITAVTSAVDKYLLKDIVSATTTAGAADIADSVAQALQSLMGSTSSDSGSGTSLAQGLADLETAVSALVDDPNSDTLKAQLVSALDTLASQFRTTGQGIQTLRGQADQQIADGVSTANEALQSIANLNTQILSAKTKGESTADLEDQRNLALQTVAAQLDVNYYLTSEGSMRVTTTSGTALVDSKAHLLDYTPAALATADTVFSAITVDGKAIDSEIKSGTLGGLLTARDTTLPAVQSELDALANAVVSTLNTAYGGTLLTGTGANSISVSAALVATPTSLAIDSTADATALQSAITGNYTFARTDSIAAGSRTFASYASTIVGNVATASSSAATRNEAAQSSLTSTQDAMSSKTGVNLDEETAKLSELEQYYAVAAQILTTLNAMFDSLLTAVKST